MTGTTERKELHVPYGAQKDIKQKENSKAFKTVILWRVWMQINKFADDTLLLRERVQIL